MFLDHVFRVAPSHRARLLIAVAVAAAIVVTSAPAESATRKKQATATPAAMRHVASTSRAPLRTICPKL